MGIPEVYKYPRADLQLPYEQFVVLHPTTKRAAWQKARQRQGLAGTMLMPRSAVFPPEASAYLSDKKIGTLNWREANAVMRDMRQMKADAGYSQTFANINFGAIDHDITVIALCDTHIGALGSDTDLLERFTDDIMSEPDLYVAFLGDATEMAINMRGVDEMMSQVLDPALQLDYFESWLTDSGISERILFSTWGNHDTGRQQKYTGDSSIARAMSRRFIYHNGIGHIDLTIGKQTYKIAASHRFRGSSLDHPCHSGIRYMLREGSDREIALAGDSHRPGRESVYHSGVYKLAINGGTMHTDSGYAKQNFSLFTTAAFPCITFSPEHHLFTDFMTIDHWREHRRLGSR